MAHIAEELLLLLLDNAAARPRLDRKRREKVLSAAVLLDLAYACRIRPSMASEPVPAGRLVALAGPGTGDPVLDPALDLLLRRPISPALAIAKLRRDTPDNVLTALERSGQTKRIHLRTKRFKRQYAWTLTDRSRVTQARTALLSTLFYHHCPPPSTAAIISLLHAVDGLGALLSLNDQGWQWVRARAGEIAGGSWVDEGKSALPEVNLAVTTAAMRQALR